jgi:hypothetical protein
MVFSVKCAGLHALLFATAMVMRRQVLCAGLQFVTIDTLALSGDLVDNYFAKRRTDPFLKGQVKAFFVTRPVVLGLKAIGAKGALKWSRAFISVCFRRTDWESSPPAPFLGLQTTHRPERVS